MQNKDVAAMFRDAARAHYCEELYKVCTQVVVFDAAAVVDCDADAMAAATAGGAIPLLGRARTCAIVHNQGHMQAIHQNARSHNPASNWGKMHDLVTPPPRNLHGIVWFISNTSATTLGQRGRNPFRRLYSHLPSAPHRSVQNIRSPDPPVFRS